MSYQLLCQPDQYDCQDNLRNQKGSDQEVQKDEGIEGARRAGKGEGAGVKVGQWIRQCKRREEEDRKNSIETKKYQERIQNSNRRRIKIARQGEWAKRRGWPG